MIEVVKEREDKELIDYLSITVIEGIDLIAANDDGTSNPYFFMKLNSSKTRRKSKIIKGTTSPNWEHTMGFEINNVIKGRIVDGLQIDVMSYNVIGRASPLGICYVELNGIKLGDIVENEYPIQNKKNQGKLKNKDGVYSKEMVRNSR